MVTLAQTQTPKHVHTRIFERHFGATFHASIVLRHHMHCMFIEERESEWYISDYATWCSMLKLLLFLRHFSFGVCSKCVDLSHALPVRFFVRVRQFSSRLFRFSQITREGQKAMVLRPMLSVFIVTCCHFFLFTLPRFFVITIGQYEDVRYRVNIQYVYSMPNEVSVPLTLNLVIATVIATATTLVSSDAYMSLYCLWCLPLLFAIVHCYVCHVA